MPVEPALSSASSAATAASASSAASAPLSDEPASSAAAAASSPPPPSSAASGSGTGRSRRGAPPPPSAGPRFASQLAAGALGAALALIVAAALWATLGRDDGANNTDARLAGVESKLGELSRRDPGAGDLGQRLGRVETALANPRAPAADPGLASRLAAIETQTKPLADGVQARRTDDAVAAAREARERADTAAKSLADIAQQLAQLNAERARTPVVERGDLDALGARVASLETATKSLGDQVTRNATAAAGSVRHAVVVIALNAAVERGAPYARELAALDPALAGPAALAALKPFATTGVPSTSTLAHELATLMPEAYKAADVPVREGGLLDRLQANAERLVRIRPIDQAPGDTPVAILTRLDGRAARGDTAGARAEAAKLPPNVRTPLDSWIAHAGGARRRAGGGRRAGVPRIRSGRPAGDPRCGPAMIRVVFFLLVVAACALGAAWLADRPGEVVITWPWLGKVIEIQLAVLIAAVALIAIGAILLWSLARTIWRSPRNVAAFVRHRRAARGQHAISRGLIAIGAGDLQGARRHANEARRYAPHEPHAPLLGAQMAQLEGNRPAAELAFRQMADHRDTKLLGLHGLFVEAQRRNDMAAAHAVAEEAVAANPAAAWAAQAVLDFRCAQHDWAGALSALDSNLASGLIDKPAFRRSRAVLLTARALSGASRDAAKADVLEAVKLSPGLVPAAALAGRFLSEAGEVRKGVRLLEAAWRAHPHPDLAETYAHVRTGDSARDRLSRVQSLAKLTPDVPEGMLAVAHAAIDAREFALARAALAPLTAAPTRRVALLMARIEDDDTGDLGRARAWMARAVHAARDPAWTADGLVSDKWLPVSPATGRLDAFEWKVPLADLSPPGRVIEQREPDDRVEVAPAAIASRPAPVEPPPASPAPVVLPDDGAPDLEVPPHQPANQVTNQVTNQAANPAARDDTAAQTASTVTPLPRRTAPTGPHPADRVIPLVHSPDDPGPDVELAADPAPEPPGPDAWWRRRPSR